ncbi:MAG: hypothetical protein J1F32_01690 [Erysipelotrichales bacterium]|nr:hypothetical protein [Erysipelotrichales bacterium]
MISFFDFLVKAAEVTPPDNIEHSGYPEALWGKIGIVALIVAIIVIIVLLLIIWRKVTDIGDKIK